MEKMSEVGIGLDRSEGLCYVGLFGAATHVM